MPNLPLQIGSRGPDVVTVKRLLHLRGLHKDSTYPLFTRYTAEMVHLFQMKFLSDDKPLVELGVSPGVVDTQTWNALHGQTNQKLNLRPGRTGGIKADSAAADQRRAFLEFCQKRHQYPTREIPKGSNWGDGVVACLQHVGLDPNPWCAAEMVYCLHQSGNPSLPSGKSARVCSIWNACRKAGIAFTCEEAQPCPGDLFVMLHAPLRSNKLAPNVNGHIGAVASVRGNYFLTYEGNSDDRVASRKRSLYSCVGFIKWTADVPYKAFTSVIPDSGNSSRDR